MIFLSRRDDKSCLPRLGETQAGTVQMERILKYFLMNNIRNNFLKINKQS